MNLLQLAELDPEKLQRLTAPIAFWTDLRVDDQLQFQLLMESSQLVELTPGEILGRKGARSSQIFSLVRGSLDVFPEIMPGDRALSQLSPGQIIGALGVLNDEPRTATLAASTIEGAQVIATDLAIAGRLVDFSKVNLNTKIRLYRNVVNNTRWKLEVYKNSTNDLTLKQELSLFKPFAGDRNSKEELEFLAEQCEGLGILLDCWNVAVEPTIAITPVKAESAIGKVFGMFKKSKESA
ncbi:Uncharacterised protein [BD1-7 clade bacterium]|uniref:Cyclic nucleotide-binding domain-containing protein n=1 Tax=BD1-7 clade bacterium TaxID=2029982 RepID=A0A5S9NRK5_9GAMM|nr:Uncharacterised protein [BD1-7 clade bacterium]CAA0093193.1 Uncharacterised protein [BD1-7 clade bacterium]